MKVKNETIKPHCDRTELTVRALPRAQLRRLLICALFAAATAAGAFIRIPFGIVPFTLQTFFVSLSGIVLGAKWGAASQMLYVALGLLGLPVFTGGGGPQYVLQPSFGYLVGFIVGAFVTGSLLARTKKIGFLRTFACALTGLVCVYVVGTPYLYVACNWILGTPVSAWTALWTGTLVFIPTDIALTAAACAAGLRLRAALGRI